MKKRALALILCLVLVATVLVSCGETDYDKSKEYVKTHQPTPEKSYVTLNLYIPADGNIDDTTVKAMQTEFNKVIEPKYRTRVAFHLIDATDTVNSYRDLIAGKAQIAKERADAGVKDITTPALGDKFPSEGESQFDIFVALDLDMVRNMIDSGYVTELTGDLTGKYQSILKNVTREDISITPAIYNNATVDGKYYGVPSNFLIGNYTYEVYERAFFERYYAGGIIGEDHVASGVTAEELQYLVSAPEYNAKHITVNAADTGHRVTYATRYEIGDMDVVRSWDNYVIVVSGEPILDYTELFRGMFCISSTCANKDRALEVIAEIYTNAALHTTLQYGARDLTYTLAEDENGNKIVTPIADAPLYRINTRYTGNILTLYPTASASIGTECGFTDYAIGLQFARNAILQNTAAKYTAPAN